MARSGEAERAPRRLLEVAGGRRVPLEMARDFLTKRRDDEVAARAVALLDEAIELGDWGPWPWSGAPLPQT
jgi:hypothetical protein